MAHSHLPTSHPLYAEWPKHNMPKAECDRLWTEYLHDHVGRRCVKDVKPGNVQATCIIKGEDKVTHTALERDRQEAAFAAFMDKEERRIATLMKG